MKKFVLFLLFFCFVSFCNADIPLERFNFVNNSQSLEAYLYEKIENINAVTTFKEHTLFKNEEFAIYQTGYDFGRRCAYFEILDFLRDNP